MAAEVSHLVDIKDKLTANKEAKNTLNDLNTILENCTSNSEILQVSTIVNPQLLFLYLSSDSESIVSITCRVLSKMLNAFPFVELNKMSQQFELALQHTNEHVRLLCLNLLFRKMELGQVFHQIILQPTMFHLVTILIGDSSLKCSQMATKILERLLREDTSCSAVLSSSLSEGFLLDLKGLVSDRGDIVRFRVYEFLVKTCGIDDSLFSFVSCSGFIEGLIGELESQDVLLKLNCLELLQLLIEFPLGVGVVHSSDILRKLHTLLMERDNDPFASVFVPGIIKFFGHYCHLTPPTIDLTQMTSLYPNFLQVTLEAIQNPQDDSIWGVAVDTFAFIASTQRGRGPLALYTAETETAIKVLGKFTIQAKTELRVKSLKALAVILSCEETNSEESLNNKWASLAIPNFISVVMAIAKQPFPDLHYAGLDFLTSVAKEKWGMVAMGACPGFMEYVLDRSTESDKTGKELKYDLVNTLATCPYCEEILGASVLLKLKQYVNEGPFYVLTDPASATLEED